MTTTTPHAHEERSTAPFLRRVRSSITAADVAAAGGVAGIGAAFLLSPEHIEDGPVICPFRALTGLPCPGCGLTRSWVYAAHGWWQESFASNAFGLLLVAAVLVLAVVVVARRVRRTPTAQPRPAAQAPGRPRHRRDLAGLRHRAPRLRAEPSVSRLAALAPQPAGLRPSSSPRGRRSRCASRRSPSWRRRPPGVTRTGRTGWRRSPASVRRSRSRPRPSSGPRRSPRRSP